MMKNSAGSFSGLLQREFALMVDEHQFQQAEVKVKASLLSPDDAVGATRRKTYVILQGKERLLQATVMGTKGQAFTGTQGFTGCWEMCRRCRIAGYRP